MTQAIHLDIVSLRIPTHSDMFIPIRGDNVLLVMGKEECVERRCMSQDELSVRGVFVRRELVASGFCCWWDIIKWVTRNAVCE